MDPVAVVEVGDVADAGEAPHLAVGSRVVQVGGERREPRLAEALLDDLEQRPDGSLGRPGVGAGIETAPERQGGADHRAGEREVDVGAHAVSPPRARPEVLGELLGQPPLDATGRDRHHLGGQGVLERLGDELGQHRHEPVGPFGAVEVEHS